MSDSNAEAAEEISSSDSDSNSFRSSSSSSSEAEAWSVMNDGRPRFLGGADLREAELLVDLETGRGGLKVGALRLVAGLEAAGGIVDL